MKILKSSEEFDFQRYHVQVSTWLLRSFSILAQTSIPPSLWTYTYPPSKLMLPTTLGPCDLPATYSPEEPSRMLGTAFVN